MSINLMQKHSFQLPLHLVKLSKKYFEGTISYINYKEVPHFAAPPCWTKTLKYQNGLDLR